MSLDLFLLGGSGSSGSSLLASVLDGLADLRSGPEVGVLHHRPLFTGDFQRELYRCLRGEAEERCVEVGSLRYALVPPVFLMDREFYGVDSLDAEYELFAGADDLRSFLTRLKHSFARTQGIDLPFGWVEQTPKNAVCALEFLRAIPEARFVHVVRDGRDVVCSLRRRYARSVPGHPDDAYLTVSVARWVWDVTQALRARDEPGYLEVRYEEFVRDPLTTVNRVLAHLGRASIDQVAFDAHRAQQLGRVDERMQGGAKPTWTSHPDQPITDEAVGRWREELTGELLQAALAFSFVPPGEGPTTTFGRLLAELDYN